MSSSSSSSSFILEQLSNGLVSSDRKCTRRFTIFLAVLFVAYTIFVAHILFRANPKSPHNALKSNLRQFPPPLAIPLQLQLLPKTTTTTMTAVPAPPLIPLPLPPPYSSIIEDCKHCEHLANTCVDDLASISGLKYARSTIEVVSIAFDEIYNQTVIARTKLERKVRDDEKLAQPYLTKQCVEMAEKILNFMYSDGVVWDKHDTLEAFIEEVLSAIGTCVYEFDWVESEADKSLRDFVVSVWDRADRLVQLCSCFVYQKHLANMRLQELNPQPLMLFTGKRYG